MLWTKCVPQNSRAEALTLDVAVGASAYEDMGKLKLNRDGRPDASGLPSS